MPKYDYTCNKCGEYKEHYIELTVVKTITDWPELDCGCGGKFVKQFSNPYIILQEG